MAGAIAPKDLKDALHGDGELAILDVREFGQYGENHLLFGVTCPFSRLEGTVERLVPCKAAPVVVYDEDGGAVADAAAAALERLGYRSVHTLDGGAAGWSAAGYALFKGVNVPSKAFGELVEHALHVPSLGADEVDALRRDGKVVILDGRPLAEYRKMNIPGAVCCPNGELAYRIADLVPDAGTTVVINCAGRTRSLIGAQILRSFGIANPVYALRNGTMGWRLSGRELESGNDRRYGEAPAADRAAALRRTAEDLAATSGAARVDAAKALSWLADRERTTYLLDVRTAEEFRAGHLAGAVHAPGGQLLQATDHWVAVRRSRLVIVDDDGVRAPVIAHWLRQMGWDASWLAMNDLPAPSAWTHVPPRPAAPAVLPGLPTIRAADLPGLLADGSVHVVDIRPGMVFRAARIAGSRWAIRPRLADAGLGGQRVVLVADDLLAARAHAGDLAALGADVAGAVTEGPERWREAGLEVAADPGHPPDEACIDYLFFVHDRHDGNLEAARRYIEWELGLVERMDERDLATFRIAPPR